MNQYHTFDAWVRLLSEGDRSGHTGVQCNTLTYENRGDDQSLVDLRPVVSG